MTSRKFVFNFGLLFFFHWITACIVRGQIPEPVSITLNPTSFVNGAFVRIGDIGSIRGGTQQMRDHISRLDLIERPGRGRLDVLPRTHVKLRLLIAGFTAEDFRLLGSETVQVQGVQLEIDDTSVLRAIQQACGHHWRRAADDVVAELTVPLVLREEQRVSGVTKIEVSLPSRANPGRLRLHVRLYQDDTLLHVLPVMCNVKLKNEAVVARVPLEAGDVIEQADVTIEKRVTDSLQIESSENLIGQQLRRAVPAGQVITARELAPKRRQTHIVRPRDVVRMVATKGNMKVSVTNGIVLQSGRLGDFVRVRNSRSQKVVTGKVISSSEVVIVF